MDIRLRLAENIVNIRYGVSADQERSRVMKHVTQDLTRRVWRREQDIVSGALPGKHETSVIKNKNYIFFHRYLVICLEGPRDQADSERGEC